MALALAWLLIALATTQNQGFYTPTALVYLILAALLLLAPPTLLGTQQDHPRAALLAVALLATLYGLLVTLAGLEGARYHAGWTQPWIALAQLGLVGGLLSYAPAVGRRLPAAITRYRFATLLAANALITGLAVVGSRARFDVFNFLDEGVRGLVRGQNPYAMTFTPPGYPSGSTFYDFDVYSYLPGTLLLTLPAVVLPDVRWPLLIVTLGTAMVLRQLGRQLADCSATGELVALAFLSYPGLLFVLQEGYSEPLTAGLWIGALTAQCAARPRWAVVLAGLLLSIKQVNPPLLGTLVIGGMSRRGLVAALLISGLVTLPFLLWSPADLIWDTLIFQLLAPMPGLALSLNGYLAARQLPPLPLWVSYGLPLIVAGYAGWTMWARRELAGALRLTAAFYLVLFLFNKFSYANYYVLLQAIVLVALAAAAGRAKPTPADP